MVILAASVLPGCSPDKPNIQLRKEKQQLQAQIAELQQRIHADRARIAGLESTVGSVPTLPQERLDKLITVQGIKLGRLSGGDPGDGVNAPDEGLKIYLVPFDDTGEALKAAGSVEVDAFDLELPSDNRVGHWTIDPDTLKSRWRSLGMLRAFVLELPWQKPPQHPKLAVKVKFRDELTGRVYDAIQEVRVKPPDTRPATRTVDGR